MASRIASVVVAFCASLFALYADAGEGNLGLRDPAAGTVTLNLFPDAYDCPGTHDVSIRFQTLTIRPQFGPVPWLVVPPTTTLQGDGSDYVDVQVPLGDLRGGKYHGLVIYRCESCSEHACGGQVRVDQVHVEVAAPATFGAGSTDSQFGGLVDGKPVSIHDLVVNIVNEIEESSFMEIDGASDIITTLESKYLDRALTSNDLSDVSFVKTVGSSNKTGMLDTSIVPVDDESLTPGNGRYIFWGFAGAEEEIFVGVDMSLKGITEARRNPQDYYVFMLDGQMGIVNKADFVHSIIHEGFHAVLGGKYNCAKPSGGRGGCLEEEQEGFRVGNAAARALGLAEDPTVPGPGYDAGSNPEYELRFPQLLPGSEADDPTRSQTEDKTSKETSAAPAAESAGEQGYCRSDGLEFDCAGMPNYALTCDTASLGDNACAIEEAGRSVACSFEAGTWSCNEMPPAVARCTELECAVVSTAESESCAESAGRFVCDGIPTYALACDAAKECRLEDPTRRAVAADPDAYDELDAAAQFLYAATQDLDCDKAGTGEPESLRELTGTYADSEMFYRSGSAGTLTDWLANYPASIDWFGGANLELGRLNSQAPASDIPATHEFMIFPDIINSPSSAWPGPGSRFADAGHNQDPLKGLIAATPETTGIVGLWDTYYQMHGRRKGSITIRGPLSSDGPAYADRIRGVAPAGKEPFTGILFDGVRRSTIQNQLAIAGITNIASDPCRVVLVPTDPNYARTGRNGGNSWGAKQDDQWAIKRVGFTDDITSAWNKVTDPELVVVAVIDTGLDWHHRDIDYRSIWRNEREIADNGIDDDGNGYVDDVIGWDFSEQDNRPWDYDGHGTVVAGIIAAQHNDVGIAGVNPRAQIMVLKGINNFGTSRASWLAEAIVYAVDNGAQVINLSVGGPHTSNMEQTAIAYAKEKGVLVVAASGNSGIELDDFGPAGDDNVITVGATHHDDRAAAFSNFGDKVDLVAPGVDVLSLRARYTDANYRPGQQEESEYTVGDNYVGDDKRYLYVSGTSFSTPIVAGVASLVMSEHPSMTAAEVENILLHTAEDIDFPGRDQYTGYGMVDARAALSVDTGFSLTAEITRVELLPADAPQFAQVHGTIDASDFKRAWVQIGPGENPGGWRFVGQKRKYPIKNGVIATIPINQFYGASLWQVVVNVEAANGVLKRAVFPIEVQ